MRNSPTSWSLAAAAYPPRARPLRRSPCGLPPPTLNHASLCLAHLCLPQMDKPVFKDALDVASGVLMPLYDPDLHVMYLGGKASHSKHLP